MPKIQCPTCKSAISSRKAYASCPWCGAALPEQLAEHFRVENSRRKNWRALKEWVGALVVVTFSGCLITLGYSRIDPETTDYAWRTQKVLATCQSRIAGLSFTGEIQTPPDVKNYGTFPDFYFVWPKGSFYSTNLNGMLKAASATCRGDLRSGRIIELSLNGEDVTTRLQHVD
jgi:hypothetical protein